MFRESDGALSGEQCHGTLLMWQLGAMGGFRVMAWAGCSCHKHTQPAFLVQGAYLPSAWEGLRAGPSRAQVSRQNQVSLLGISADTRANFAPCLPCTGRSAPLNYVPPQDSREDEGAAQAGLKSEGCVCGSEMSREAWG